VIGERGVVEATAAARGALFAPTVLLGDHLHRHPNERPHVGGHEAVAARHHHDLVLAAEMRHHLNDPRVERPGVLFQAFEQGDLGGVRQAGERIVRVVELACRAAVGHLHRRIAAVTRDGAGGLRRRSQGVETDVVGVRERRLLAADRTHAHALVDREAARLHDAFLEAPAFRTGVLEIEIGVVDRVGHDVPEHPLQLADVEGVRCEQAAIRGGEQVLCKPQGGFALYRHGSLSWMGRTVLIGGRARSSGPHS
jgi:hypothetical protein